MEATRINWIIGKPTMNSQVVDLRCKSEMVLEERNGYNICGKTEESS